MIYCIWNILSIYTYTSQKQFVKTILSKDHHDLKQHTTFTRLLFDLIECFTTTFLHAHSWLSWVDEDDDEDEVGLKEKPEDTRYIKKITSK